MPEQDRAATGFLPASPRHDAAGRTDHRFAVGGPAAAGRANWASPGCWKSRWTTRCCCNSSMLPARLTRGWCPRGPHRPAGRLIPIRERMSEAFAPHGCAIHRAVVNKRTVRRHRQRVGAAALDPGDRAGRHGGDRPARHRAIVQHRRRTAVRLHRGGGARPERQDADAVALSRAARRLPAALSDHRRAAHHRHRPRRRRPAQGRQHLPDGAVGRRGSRRRACSPASSAT